MTFPGLRPLGSDAVLGCLAPPHLLFGCFPPSCLGRGDWDLCSHSPLCWAAGPHPAAALSGEARPGARGGGDGRRGALGSVVASGQLERWAQCWGHRLPGRALRLLRPAAPAEPRPPRHAEGPRSTPQLKLQACCLGWGESGSFLTRPEAHALSSARRVRCPGPRPATHHPASRSHLGRLEWVLPTRRLGAGKSVQRGPAESLAGC